MSIWMRLYWNREGIMCYSILNSYQWEKASKLMKVKTFEIFIESDI